MMKVRYFATIRHLTGHNETEWKEPAPTVRELLRGLARKYGPAFQNKVFEGDRLSPIVIVMVNGRNIEHLGGEDTPLLPEDEVSIFPMVAGGGPLPEPGSCHSEPGRSGRDEGRGEESGGSSRYIPSQAGGALDSSAPLSSAPCPSPRNDSGTKGAAGAE